MAKRLRFALLVVLSISLVFVVSCKKDESAAEPRKLVINSNQSDPAPKPLSRKWWKGSRPPTPISRLP
jgi:hypothetical protein